MPGRRLEDRVAIVTGASSGIGRAIALRFASEGASVVIGDVRRDPREGGSATDQAIVDAGGRATFVETNVTQWADVDQLVGTTVSTFGRLDVMVNNAGIWGRFSKPLLETTEEDWDTIMAVNLRGVFLCCKRAIGEMIEQEPIGEVRGRVINVSSQHGMVGQPGHAAYGASKGGVVNFTHQLAVDYGPRGVIVNAVAPGKILTGLAEQVHPDAIAYSKSRTPFSRLGNADDVAGAALFLASDDATYVSGINLLVDGGWMAY